MCYITWWDYMCIYALGTIFVQLALGLNAFITAQGYAKTSMYTVLIGAVCNTVLDPIFIFGFGMGVQGAALATILSQAISSVWVVWFLCSGKSMLRIRKADLRLQPKVIFPCMLLGLSPFIMQLIESVISVCFNTSLLKYGGDLAVGAMTILMSVMQFTMLPLQGLTQGAQPIVSFNYGARKLDRVKRTVQLLLISCLCYSVLLWGLCMFVPRLFTTMFTPNQQLADFTVRALRIYMSCGFMFGAQIACQQSFIALGKAGISICLALLRKVVLIIPLIYTLPHLVADPVTGVSLAEPVSDLIAVCATVTTFTIFFRKLMAQHRAAQQSKSA